MSKTYPANQLMKAFGITKDALFYYEKIGLLHPERNPANNYRMYSARDVLTLLEIRNMTSLGLSLADIAPYTREHSVSSTLSMIDMEIDRLRESIRQLQALESSLTHKESVIRRVQKVRSGLSCEVVHETGRHCLMLSDHDLSLSETLLAIDRLETKYHNSFSFLGCSDCYEIKLTKSGSASPIHQITRIFLYSDDPGFPSDFSLPEGDYGRMYYRGDYRQSAPAFLRLQQFMQEHHLTARSNCYAFFHISELETDDIGENVIEYLILV